MDSSGAAAPLLDALTDDQRRAATAPPGPVLCVAPAGSGKTTTLVARIAWRLADGVSPDTVCAVTFNRRAAEELAERLAGRLVPLGLAGDRVRVRTFHALGLEILRSTGREIRLAGREDVLRRIRPDLPLVVRMRADMAISRLKLELGVTPEEVAADPDPGPLGRLYLDYSAALHEEEALDFDDLVVESLRTLRTEAALRARWRHACGELLVDEVQDVDRSQLDLALLLSAPADRIFLVGDDDQCIYAWRLADVRRVLQLAGRLPGLDRVDLVTNFRCPASVVDRAVRLIEHNHERFAKTIRAGSGAGGRLTLAPDGDADHVRFSRILASWPPDGTSRAILARTNRELLPAVVAAIEADQPFRAERLQLLLEHPALDPLLELAATSDPGLRLLRRLASVVAVDPVMAVDPGVAFEPVVALDRGKGDAPDVVAGRPAASEPTDDLDALRRAVLAWAAPFPDLPAFDRAVRTARDRLRALHRPDAPLTLATAHATKGLEFDHVAVVMDAQRFPSARTLGDSDDPERALEEERRLAYVAWTRARRSLTLLYDPAAPSSFLLEAFDPDELGTIDAEP